MSAVDTHRAVLRRLAPEAWAAYLAEHSGLPGPRGNIELAKAVAEEATPVHLRRLAASADEFEAVCGAVGLGRVLADGDDRAADELHTLAGDARWRVREGVAMAVQRLGDADVGAALALCDRWADDAPLVQRAAVAGMCEPRLLRSADAARATLDLLDRVTASLAAARPEARRDADRRVLRQALGYCWSVAVAALPDEGLAHFERWAEVDDPDVAWVVRENRKKSRLARLVH